MCEKTRLQLEVTAKELVSRLLQDEFNKNSNWWQMDDAKEVIDTARFYALHKLADQMENDLNF